MGHSLWERRIANAIRAKKKWEDKFRCNTLEQYYEGFHWKNKTERTLGNYNPYTINMFYSTIKIKLAGLLFQCPRFNLSPRPGNMEWNPDSAVQSSELKQDVLNTIINNPNTFFIDNIRLACLDSFFRFAVVEYGYSADWRNPQKELVELKSWEISDVDDKHDRVISSNEVPVNERFYIKHIPARNFIVSVCEATELRDHDWCGYPEYLYTSQLQNTKGIKWIKEAEPGYLSGEYTSTGSIGDDTRTEELKALISEGSVSKVWHIFDNVAHKRKLYLDRHFEKSLWEDDMENLPIVDHRWDFRLQGFYPIPPCFQWLSPQDEINESREQTRSYRRRFTRKFQSQVDTVTPEELEKFVSGPDGIVVETKISDAIRPIANPDQSSTEVSALIVAKDDFNIISGTSAEARGQSDRETATQARIKDMRSRIRESADSLDFSNFIVKIGRGILATAQQKLSIGMWIKQTSNPYDSGITDMKPNMPVYKYISGQDLSDGFDADININLENATPAAQEEDFMAYSKFVGMIQNFPMLAMSPTLIRETAFRCGYRNERVIHQMQQVAVASLAAKAQQAEQQQQLAQAKSGQMGGANPSNAARTLSTQSEVPDAGQIGQQVNQQLGVE